MSVLDDRIRRIAREEAASTGLPSEDGSDPLTELREQLATLTTRIDDLEKSAVTRADLERAAVTQPAAAKRTARKTTAEPSEKTAESGE